MKRRISLAFSLCLLLMMMTMGMACADGAKDLLVDQADLLTDAEEAKLEKKLNSLSDEYDLDVVIVTVNSLEGKTAEAFADDYFDYNGYGRGNEHEGILFLRDAGDRYYAISACGEHSMDVFPSSECENISDNFVDELKADNFKGACESFIEDVEYDLENYGKYKAGFWILVAVIGGVLVGFIGAGISKSQLKSVAMRGTATEYYKKESFAVTQSSDRFLYRNVERREKPKDNSNGSHTSSSGRSHTGSSGRA